MSDHHKSIEGIESPLVKAVMYGVFGGVLLFRLRGLLGIGVIVSILAYLAYSDWKLFVELATLIGIGVGIIAVISLVLIGLGYVAIRGGIVSSSEYALQEVDQ